MKELLARLLLFLIGMVAAALLGSIDWAPAATWPLPTRLAAVAGSARLAWIDGWSRNVDAALSRRSAMPFGRCR